MTRAAVEALLGRLQAAGVRVALAGDRLRLTPTDRVSPELVTACRTFKAQLICQLSWDQDDAQRALDDTLRRIGRLCTALPDDATFWSDQRRVDCEEAVSVAFARRDRQALNAALTDLEGYCLERLGLSSG